MVAEVQRHLGRGEVEDGSVSIYASHGSGSGAKARKAAAIPD